MSEQAGFVVIAEFHMNAADRAAFVEHAHEDARQSLANEPGCHQFDVLAPIDDETRVVLHEAYTNRAAFDAHTAMPHYEPFKNATAPLLTDEPSVRFFEFV